MRRSRYAMITISLLTLGAGAVLIADVSARTIGLAPRGVRLCVKMSGSGAGTARVLLNRRQSCVQGETLIRVQR